MSTKAPQNGQQGSVGCPCACSDLDSDRRRADMPRSNPKTFSCPARRWRRETLVATSLFLSDVLTAPRISTELWGHAVDEEVKQPCNQRRSANRGASVETDSEERFRRRL